MMATHLFGTLESAYPEMQLLVFYSRALRVLFECCVKQRPGGKCHIRFIRKFCTIRGIHRNAVSVLSDITRVNCIL
jgi:hypothetical protein